MPNVMNQCPKCGRNTHQNFNQCPTINKFCALYDRRGHFLPFVDSLREHGRGSSSMNDMKSFHKPAVKARPICVRRRKLEMMKVKPPRRL